MIEEAVVNFVLRALDADKQFLSSLCCNKDDTLWVSLLPKRTHSDIKGTDVRDVKTGQK